MADVEKSLSIVIKARDEASAKMREMQQTIKKGAMSAIAPFLAIGAAVATAAKAAASGYEIVAAQAEQYAAKIEGDTLGILEAQVKVNDAWGKFGAAVPVVGGEIERIIRILSDTAGLQKQIEAMKEFKAVAESVGKGVAGIRTKAALLAAELAGASKAETQRIRDEGEGLAITEQRVKVTEALIKAIDVQRELEAKGGIRLIAAKKDVEKLRKIEQDLFDYGNELLKQQVLKRRVIAAEEIKAAEKARADLEDSITTALADETEKRVLASEKGFDELVAKAREAGMDIVSLERKRGDETVRIRREAEERAAEAVERVRQEEARKMTAALAKRERELASEASDRMALEDIVFNATHGQREEDLRDLERMLGEQRQKYAGNQEMLAKIEKAGKIRRAEIEAAELQRAKQVVGGGAADQGTEVAAFTSRFLARAPGREKPAWVRDVTGATEGQTKAFKEALVALGNKLAAAFLEQRPEVGVMA